MPSDISCPNCGNEISSSSRYCPHCSARLCTNCHKIVPPDARYCPWCNFLLIGTGIVQPPASAPPPYTTLQWSPPTIQHTPASTPQPWPTDIPSTEHRTPGGFITGRHPTTPSGGPPPPHTPSYEYEQRGEQAEKIPIPSTFGRPESYDEYTYGADAEAAATYAQPQDRGKQQAPRWESQTWAQAGIKDIKMHPPAWLIAIILIVVVGILGFVVYNFGLMQGPANAVKAMISKIEMPSSIPLLSSIFNRNADEDNTPPAISNIMITNVTNTGAVIIWVTDEPATSQVMFCEPDGLCCWTELDKTLVTSHSVTAKDLKADTQYHYTVSSLDGSENEGTYEGELTTLSSSGSATTSTGLLLISGITVSNVSETSATIKWKTSIGATGQVEYGKTAAYGSTVSSSQQATTEHSLTLTNLEPNTTYHFRLRLRDTSGNEVTSETDRIFSTSTLSAGISEGIENGMRAPNFTLQTLDGRNVNLTDYRGKLLMVNFWGGGYHRSKNELSVLQEIYDTWSSKGLVILGVNFKETPTEVQQFVDEKNITYTVLLDPNGKVHKQYGSPSIPATFFLDKSGIIREIRYSAISVAGTIEAILESMQ